MKPTPHSMLGSEPTLWDNVSGHLIGEITLLWQFLSTSMLLTALLSSFLAILTAGLIIASHNHKFLKHERWCRTADEFCVTLEKIIVDYFSGQNDEVQKRIAFDKYYAYLDAFTRFVGEKDVPEIDTFLGTLMNVSENSESREEMNEALLALSAIRFAIPLSDDNDQLLKLPVVVTKARDSAIGIAAFAFGFLSIFFLTLLFALVSFVFAIIAVTKNQIKWAIAGVICALIGIFTSPKIFLMLGFASS